MLSLTRKTDYALIAMADLAQQAPLWVSAREISRRLGLPLPALTNILKQLTRYGLVTSTRGPSGGYRLARHPERITLTELIEAVEGPMRLTWCCPVPVTTDERKCDLEGECTIKDPVQRLHEGLQNLLSQVTLDQILRNTVSIGIDATVSASR